MAMILLVFDDRGQNPLLCELLEKLGHHCIGVHTGECALRILQTQRPDLVVLDFMTPDIDGLEFLRRIHAERGAAAPPVIMFSEIADPGFGRYVISRGANDYWIRGTMDLTRLNDMIALHLGS
jgi:two-component system phosphate regulon response regulator PhoB